VPYALQPGLTTWHLLEIWLSQQVLPQAAPPCSAPHPPPPSVLMRLCVNVPIARVQGGQSRAPWAPAPPLAGLRRHLLVPHAPAPVRHRSLPETQPKNSNPTRCSRFALCGAVRAAPQMSGHSICHDSPAAMHQTSTKRAHTLTKSLVKFMEWLMLHGRQRMWGGAGHPSSSCAACNAQRQAPRARQ
jgi:hypothetical protein